MSISFSSSSPREARARGAGVTAVLGPTNTGKTHLAIERMLAHSSGIIGLPLRLLAREVYQKVADRIGVDKVALVTGEEKIKPAHPRFWVSTVEAMPRDLDVAFVAVDEIQLGADLERGHVFTDRMLNRRGREETLVLGAATVRPMIDRLLPGANVVSRPRLSQLSFVGERKITRLPRRSAIVAFSAVEVYAIAELIRRQRGGAAVVLGSLSPRARNAQVALYQSGDVDYLVATDAIGMGLNLDVDHVAFASDRKFDGYQFRKLNPSEMAQIAGRAGRATRDGTFGTTGRCPPFEPELVQQLEAHAFEPLRVMQWRNSALDFGSLAALSASLAAIPSAQGLTRAPIAEDILVLEYAGRDDGVRAVATTRKAVETLWDACQLPDYRKTSAAAHAELVVTLYGFLMREGTIATDWFARQVAQADRTDGDIDTLSARIAHIRTWTFAANRPDWLSDPEHWQGVTRAVEDKLSDALHERLAERFVDRRTSVLMRRLRENVMLETEITKTGDVLVEGHTIGRLDGFRFAADATAGGSEAKALSAAAQKALAGEIEGRATKLSQAADAQFVLSSDATIRWMGEPVAKLTAGDNVLRPRARVLSDDHLSGPALELVQQRLDLWVRSHIEKLLGPLFVLGAAADIEGLARGIAFQLVERLGVLERSKIGEELKSLDQGARATLRKHGVRFGAYHVYVPALLKPGPRALAAELWVLKHGGPETKGLDDLQRLAASGRTSFPADKEVDKTLYRTIGYRVCGERALRVDILERLADLIRPALSWRPGSPGVKPAGAFGGTGFTVTQAMTSLTGSAGEDFASILKALGYRMEKRPKLPDDPIPAVTPDALVATPIPDASDAATESDSAPHDETTAQDAAATETADAASDVVPDETADTSVPMHVDEALPVARPDAAVDESGLPDVGWGIAPAAPHDVSSQTTVPEDTAAAPDPVLSQAAVAEATAAEASETPVTEPSALDMSATDTSTQEAAASETQASEAEVSETQVSEAPASGTPAEPDLVEVWRPAGRSDGAHRRERGKPGERRGYQGHRRAPQPVAASPDSASPASGDAPTVAAAPAPGDTGPRDRNQGRRGRRSDQPRHQADGAPHAVASKPWSKNRSENRSNDRFQGQAKGRNTDHNANRTADRAPRRDERPARPERVADPNSPFAKLAALKAQLEADAKDRR